MIRASRLFDLETIAIPVKKYFGSPDHFSTVKKHNIFSRTKESNANNNKENEIKQRNKQINIDIFKYITSFHIINNTTLLYYFIRNLRSHFLLFYFLISSLFHFWGPLHSIAKGNFLRLLVRER